VNAEAPEVRRGFWRALASNLSGGLRLFSLRRVSPAHFTSSFDQVAVLLAIVLSISACFDWLRAEPDATFTGYGVANWAFFLLIGFWACALAARLQSPRSDTRALLVPVLATSPYVVAVIFLLYQLPFAEAAPNTLAVVATAIAIAMSIRAIRAAYGMVRVGPLAVVMVTLVGVPWLVDALYINSSLWEVLDAADGAPSDGAAAESVLFEEPERVAEAVEQLAPQRPALTDVFYLGFAGDGAQRVFRSEALFAEKKFADHFGSASRSLELINDATDRESFPLATVSGLRRALGLIAERMDVADDVLVLMITSHGSQEEGIAVSNGTLPLAQLRPEDLREALDEAGIRWRVVIVSACYAGVFLDALKSDTTLVVTASDANDTSFGCANDRDLTYFGEAFLRDALPGSRTLEAAFVKARTLIADRERAENLTPSNPQIEAGPAIRQKLASLESVTRSAATAVSAHADAAK